MFIELTPQHTQVIDALASGASMTAAAEQAGVHRNTIANWRRHNPVFAEALISAQYDRAIDVRDRAESLLDLAFQTLQSILADPQAPASVRLKAALHVIGVASTPPDPQKIAEYEFNPIDVPTPPESLNYLLHKTAQSAVRQPTSQTSPHSPGPAQESDPAQKSEPAQESEPAVHKVAQLIRTGPKVGRNDPCPCNSGLKYKKCCLDKPQPAAA